MPTLKEEQQSIFSILGPEIKDAAGATVKLEEWRGIVTGEHAAQSQLQELFALTGCTDYSAAAAFISGLVSAANTFRANQSALWSALGTPGKPVTDQAGAIAAIELFKNDLATAQAAVTDFDGRVKAAVITQAASAGLPAVVPKVPAETVLAGGKVTMTRDAFNAMPPQQRVEFSTKGGTLTDA